VYLIAISYEEWLINVNDFREIRQKPLTVSRTAGLLSYTIEL
jgi:hypothetical protein